MLSCPGVCQAAQPFLAVLLQKIFPRRPILVVTDGLKTQESFQQDIETWLVAERGRTFNSQLHGAPKRSANGSTLNFGGHQCHRPAPENLSAG